MVFSAPISVFKSKYFFLRRTRCCFRGVGTSTVLFFGACV